MKHEYTLDKLNEMAERAGEKGSLDLSGLTSIPEGFNPTVGGYLDLSGLTSIPEGFNPTVGGSLYLSGLTSISKNKRFKRLKQGDYVPGKYLYADGILTHVKSCRKSGGYIYYKGKIPGRNVVSDGKNYAHCDKFRDGIADLAFKSASDRGAGQYKGISLDREMSPDELVTMYRIITGACRQGSQAFIESLGKLKKKYTVKEALEITKGQYGYNSFARFFDYE